MTSVSDAIVGFTHKNGYVFIQHITNFYTSNAQTVMFEATMGVPNTSRNKV